MLSWVPTCTPPHVHPTGKHGCFPKPNAPIGIRIRTNREKLRDACERNNPFFCKRRWLSRVSIASSARKPTRLRNSIRRGELLTACAVDATCSTPDSRIIGATRDSRKGRFLEDTIFHSLRDSCCEVGIDKISCMYLGRCLTIASPPIAQYETSRMLCLVHSATR
jgi:hypothetical protein